MASGSNRLIADSQVHVWKEDSPERPWPSGGAQQARRHRQTPPPTPAEVIRAMDEAGVDRAVLVPPSFEGDRNDLALEAAHAYAKRFGVMGRIALSSQGRDVDLARWREQPGMLGVRIVFAFGGSDKWLNDGTADWFWPRAEACGIPVMVFAPGQNEKLGPVAEAHPGLKLIIDHLGIPSHTRDVDLMPIIAPVLTLSRFPNVGVKASALPCFTSATYPFEPVHDVIRRVVHTFGPERVFWGTDLTRLPCSYADAIRLFTETGILTPREADFVMGRALLQWLGWS